MFVQVIQGRTSDADGLRRQMDRWDADVRPGATGFIGSTSGVTDDGQVFVAARFDDEASARKNSDRPEQGAWWEETSKLIEGATFTESTEIDLFKGGGSNDAGFVQVIRGRATDKAALRAANDDFDAQLAQERPDLLGATTIWDGDRFFQVAYFRSEDEARKGEAATSDSELMQQFQSLTADLSFLDLRSPMFD